MRKWLGHIFFPGSLAHLVDAFLRDTLSPYLNFHRPCLFPVDVTSATGRVKKRYPQSKVATPYDRLRSLTDAEGFLRPGTTFETLDQLVLATTGLEAAQGVQRARNELMRTLAKEAHRLRSLTPDRSGPPPCPGSRHSRPQSDPPKHRSRPQPTFPQTLQVTGQTNPRAPGQFPGVCPPALRSGSALRLVSPRTEGSSPLSPSQATLSLGRPQPTHCRPLPPTPTITTSTTASPKPRAHLTPRSASSPD